MLEYIVTLEFTSPCLGNTRKEWLKGGSKRVYFGMPRTSQGHINFQPNWWRSNFRKAASVLAKDIPSLDLVLVDPVIRGTPQETNPARFYRRYYSSSIYSLHEAFMPGESIGLRVVAPPELSYDMLLQVLDTSGRFYGISPARPGEFGFFVVVSMFSGGTHTSLVG